MTFISLKSVHNSHATGTLKNLTKDVNLCTGAICQTIEQGHRINFRQIVRHPISGPTLLPHRRLTQKATCSACFLIARGIKGINPPSYSHFALPPNIHFEINASQEVCLDCLLHQTLVPACEEDEGVTICFFRRRELTTTFRRPECKKGPVPYLGVSVSRRQSNPLNFFLPLLFAPFPPHDRDRIWLRIYQLTRLAFNCRFFLVSQLTGETSEWNSHLCQIRGQTRFFPD